MVIVDLLLKDKGDWRDWEKVRLEQLIPILQKRKDDKVVYYLKKKGWREDEELDRITLPRLKEGEKPKQFLDKAKSIEKKDTDGNKYTVEAKEEVNDNKKDDRMFITYYLKETPLTPEEKITKGIELMESDIEEMVYEREEVYQEEGESSRWTQSITTVVKGEDGHLYAIHWERALTEVQENGFYSEPYRVKLEEEEVVIKKTLIIPVK